LNQKIDEQKGVFNELNEQKQDLQERVKSLSETTQTLEAAIQVLETKEQEKLRPLLKENNKITNRLLHEVRG
jgi:cell division septum initiation protein DivIVA